MIGTCNKYDSNYEGAAISKEKFVANQQQNKTFRINKKHGHRTGQAGTNAAKRRSPSFSKDQKKISSGTMK